MAYFPTIDISRLLTGCEHTTSCDKSYSSFSLHSFHSKRKLFPNFGGETELGAGFARSLLAKAVEETFGILKMLALEGGGGLLTLCRYSARPKVALSWLWSQRQFYSLFNGSCQNNTKWSGGARTFQVCAQIVTHLCTLFHPLALG